MTFKSTPRLQKVSKKRRLNGPPLIKILILKITSLSVFINNNNTVMNIYFKEFKLLNK